jgi:hypothetical protein
MGKTPFVKVDGVVSVRKPVVWFLDDVARMLNLTQHGGEDKSPLHGESPHFVAGVLKMKCSIMVSLLPSPAGMADLSDRQQRSKGKVMRFGSREHPDTGAFL